MPDLRARMVVEGWRIAREGAGYLIDRLPRTGLRRADIVAGLLRCRIVAEGVVERLGERGWQLGGAPLGSRVMGGGALGAGPARRALGTETLGGGHGPSVH